MITEDYKIRALFFEGVQEFNFVCETETTFH